MIQRDLAPLKSNVSHHCSTLYPLTTDTAYVSAERGPFGSYIVAKVCIDNPGNTNNCRLVPENANYCMVLLLKQYGLALINLSHPEF